MLDKLASLLRGPGVRFAIVGASLTVLDLVLYQLLANVVRISVLGAPAPVGAVWVGTPIVITINFFVSHRFVWRSKTSKARTVVPFFGLNLFSGVLVQSLVITGLVSAASAAGFYESVPGICNLTFKCLAVALGMVINFFGARWLFKWDVDAG